ncbi:MAG TPA: molybdopterin-dependent oxidoreductase, partial [Kiloniellales bacterium]|nr:molybdopterin-dependent oxidoreductase [Kiloniellales bacterium]
AGDLCDAESMLALKDLMEGLGATSLDCRQDGAKLDPRCRAGYLFNTTIAGIEQADACLLIGTDPRREAALINARLRKRFLMGGFRVGLIGQPVDLTYPVEALGAGPETLEDIAAGRGDFAEALKNAERPMLVLGMAALRRSDAAAVLALARKIAEDFGLVRDGWNGFNVLHTAAARVGGLDLGFVPGPGGRDLEGILEGAGRGEIEAVYLLGADEIDMNRLGPPGEGAFVIYQGHHGDAGAHQADVILPGAASPEKNATYVNTEGRVQLGRMAASPPGEAREDWTVLRALSEIVGRRLPYDSLGDLRRRLIEANPVFARVDRVAPAEWGEFGASGPLDAAPFGRAIENFYMTDPISRASETMAECTEVFVVGRDRKATGTDG